MCFLSLAQGKGATHSFFRKANDGEQLWLWLRLIEEVVHKAMSINLIYSMQWR